VAGQNKRSDEVFGRYWLLWLHKRQALPLYQGDLDYLESVIDQKPIVGID